MKLPYKHFYETGREEALELPHREGGIVRTEGYNSDKAEKGRRRKRPTESFLKSNIGKSWNKVYKRICNPPPDKEEIYALIRRDIDHQFCPYVELNPHIVNGELYTSNMRRKLNDGDFYVHSGILKQVPKKKVKRLRFKKKYMFTTINGMTLSQIDGIWYKLSFSPFERKQYTDQYHMSALSYNPYDILLCYYVTMNDCMWTYGIPYYCSGKQQLSKREKKKLGLSS